MSSRHAKAVQTMTAISLPALPVSLTHTLLDLPDNYVAPSWCADVIHEWNREADLLAAKTYPTQSVLLEGPSGTGKTTAARWIAKHLKKQLVSMNLSETIESYMGATGSRIAAGIRYAQDNGVILVMDEIDCLAASREAKSSDVGEIWRITNTFIQTLDIWHTAPRRSLIIATTNMADSIDKAIRRRFELEVRMGYATHAELSKIAGVALPEGLEISHAELRKHIVKARRYSVLHGVDYSLTLLSMISRGVVKSKESAA